MSQRSNGRSLILEITSSRAWHLHLPNFAALHRRSAGTHCIWAFDLLELRGRNLCTGQLVDRRRQLAAVIQRAGSQVLRYSEAFDDPEKLLRAVEGFGLEGIVSKRKGSPYRAGIASGWVKTKTVAWRAANAERWRQFA